MTAVDHAAVRVVARRTWADTYSGIIPGDARRKFVERVYSDEMLAWRARSGMFLVAAGEGPSSGSRISTGPSTTTAS